jgi:hypothetical protein
MKQFPSAPPSLAPKLMVKFKSKLWVKSIVEVAHTEPSCVFTGGVSVKQFPPVEKALPFVTNCPKVVMVKSTKTFTASINRMKRKYDVFRIIKKSPQFEGF